MYESSSNSEIRGYDAQQNSAKLNPKRSTIETSGRVR
jgi:hypothetical protein